MQVANLGPVRNKIKTSSVWHGRTFSLFGTVCMEHLPAFGKDFMCSRAWHQVWCFAPVECFPALGTRLGTCFTCHPWHVFRPLASVPVLLFSWRSKFFVLTVVVINHIWINRRKGSRSYIRNHTVAKNLKKIQAWTSNAAQAWIFFRFFATVWLRI